MPRQISTFEKELSDHPRFWESGLNIYPDEENEFFILEYAEPLNTWEIECSAMDAIYAVSEVLEKHTAPFPKMSLSYFTKTDKRSSEDLALWIEVILTGYKLSVESKDVDDESIIIIFTKK